MEIRIRDAVLGDAAGIGRVRIDTWRTAYRGIIPDQVLAEMDYDADTRRQQGYLSNPLPDRHTFVAEVLEEGAEPRVVGFCGVGANREPDLEYSGELYAIYVLPQFQHEGIGKRLAQAGRTWLQAQGHAHFILWVLRDNLPARRFYESIGGQAVREHMVNIRGVDLPEVGYGYVTADGLIRE